MSIQISDQALNQIRTSAQAEEIDLAAVMLRVAVVPGGCSGLSYELGWDTTLQETDVVSSMDEVRVVVDKKSALYLEGSQLDFSDGLEGEGFHFSNPQAARTCACGDSFGL
ncbi:MAG: iron-sulfur cluster assembly protein [Rhodothermales bacterium]|jgi:iron-sulfur cluster assembly protein